MLYKLLDGFEYVCVIFIAVMGIYALINCL